MLHSSIGYKFKYMCWIFVSISMICREISVENRSGKKLIKHGYLSIPHLISARQGLALSVSVHKIIQASKKTQFSGSMLYAAMHEMNYQFT